MLRKLIHTYNNLKLQTKFTITHLVIVTIPIILLAVFFYAQLYDMIVSDTISKEQVSSSQSVPLIEQTLADILDVHSQVTEHDFYRTALNPNHAELLDEYIQTPEAFDFKHTVNDLIDHEFITDIKIYVDIPETEAVFSCDSVSETVRPIKNAIGTYWYGIFKGDPTCSALFCPSFYLSPGEIKLNGTMAYITKSNIIYDGKLCTCFTAVYFSRDHFAELLKNSSDNNVTYIINSRDSVIATTDSALSGMYHFDYATVQEFFMSSNNFVSKNILGEEVYACFYKLKYTDWYLIVAIPSKPMIAKSRGIITRLALVYIICIIGAFLIATFLSRSITNRLSAVINQMSLSRLGPPVALPDSDTQDEIGDLIDTYNYMTHYINQLIDDQSKAAEDLRVAEFNSLQAQMNPHFLYNTMDMINWLSQQGKVQEVTCAIQRLSRFYKLTLSRKQSLSTIADEVEHVTIYTELQNMRFHDTIDFIVDIPDTLMEYSIPKLTLQPFIENSILHGIMEKEEKIGTIVLTGWMDENTIVLLISDDGVGIPEEKLDTILSGDAHPSHSSNNHIAVYNTHRRFQLLYGPGYGLTYHCPPEGGTEVEIRLPAYLPEQMDAHSCNQESLSDESPLVHAHSLLNQPNLTIYEIAEECGYKNPQQFSIDFKNQFGCSPDEYRLRMI